MRIWPWRAAEPPAVEPDMEQFHDGLAVLRDGRPAGHVATSLGHFTTPFAPRTPKPWVWLVVVWTDGTKEPSVEDYPPWSYVAEMREGFLDWHDGHDRERWGCYEVQWVTHELALAERERLGIRLRDF